MLRGLGLCALKQEAMRTVSSQEEEPGLLRCHTTTSSWVSFCVLCHRKEGDSEFMNIIANEIGSEVRGTRESAFTM